jgi:hypothetical protein
VPLKNLNSAGQYVLCESDIHIVGILGFRSLVLEDLPVLGRGYKGDYGEVEALLGDKFPRKCG